MINADILLIESARRILMEQRMNTRKRDLDYSEFVFIAELLDIIAAYEYLGSNEALVSIMNKLLYSTINSNIKFRKSKVINRLSDESMSGDIVDAIDIGTIGTKGDPGPRGPQGPAGPQGPQGQKGADGVKGDKGDTGAASTIPGPKGDRGEKGDKGDASTVPGPEGKEGPRGLQGEVGPKGDTGAASTIPGPPGANGIDGLPGAPGINGTNGVNGTNGTNGAKGDKGDPGRVPTIEIGEDENWILDGYITGKPSRGPQGPQGPIGPGGGDKGDPGEKGDDGFTPEIGINENWWINGVDTTKPSRGPKGNDGSQGIDGHTPVIGVNENWWINGVDTTKPSRGPQGLKGDKGDTGAPGLNGGVDGLDAFSPRITINGYWEIYNDEDQEWVITDVLARGPKGDAGDDGKSPYIGGSDSTWFVWNPALGSNGEYYDTTIKARGQNGHSPYIDQSSYMWYQWVDSLPGYQNTGISAKGIDGIVGKNGNSPKIDYGTNTWWIYSDAQNKYIDTYVTPGGQNGLTPTIGPGPDYFWFIGTANQGISAQGKDGVRGENGHSPVIGGNGNWFYWSDTEGGYEDSLVPARGLKGDDGDIGLTGDRGLSGGGVNLLNNSDFSDIVNPAEKRPRGFMEYNNARVPFQFTSASTGGAINNGPYFGIRLNGSGATTVGIIANGDLIGEHGGVIPGWLPNTTYVISYYARKVNGNGWTSGTWIRWNDNPASQIVLEGPSLTTTWKRHSFRIVTGSVVEGGGRFHITEATESDGVIGDELHISNIQVTAGESIVPWSPRAKDGLPGPTGATGAAGQSASLVFGSISIAPTDWDANKECIKADSNITANCNIIISPPANTDMYYACSEALLHSVGTIDGSIKFKTKYAISIPVTINYTIVN